MLVRLVLNSWTSSDLPILASQSGWVAWAQEFETHLGSMVKTCLYKKYKNYLGVVVHSCRSMYSGGWDGRITWAQQVEAAVSQDHATALQPGWQSETPSQKQKNKNKKKYGYMANLPGDPRQVTLGLWASAASSLQEG